MTLNIQNQILKSGRMSGMKVAAFIICNLLLKTQNFQKYSFVIDFLADFMKF